MLRATVADLTYEDPHHYILLLHQRDEKKIMGIWTSFREGPMIAWQAAGQPWVWTGPRRPLTFDLVARVLKDTGIFLQDVQIVSVQENVFYAVARVRSAAGDFEIDTRPSDAISLALALERPIYIDPQVLHDSAWDQDSIYTEPGQMGDNLAAIGDSLRAIWDADTRGFFSNCLATDTPDLPSQSAHDSWQTVKIADVRSVKGEDHMTLVLMDEGGQNVLPIQAANWDAAMLAWNMNTEAPIKQDGPDRPQTFQFLGSLFNLTGLALDEVKITGPRSGILRAEVAFSGNGHSIRTDCRPVDAIALAHQLDAPIAIRADLWAAGGVPQEAIFPSKSSIGQGVQDLNRMMRTPRTSRKNIFQKLGGIFKR
jgi:hypothetical protein